MDRYQAPADQDENPMNPGDIPSIYSISRALRPWRMEDFLAGFDCRYFSYARRALAAGLKAAGVGSGHNVLLPEFICREVLSGIAAVGARPVFYPVGKDLSPAKEPASWPSASAVLAVDYFGFPQDMGPFRAYCARTRAVLIEDNAHGLFSRDRDGLLLGARAEAGLFSLRKTLAIGDGAVLALKMGVRSWNLAPQSAFNADATTGQRAKEALRRAARLLGPAPVFHALRAFRAARGLLWGSRRATQDEARLPQPALPSRELAGPIDATEPEGEVQRRRSLYRHIEDLLKPHVLPLFPRLEEGVSPYGFAYREIGASRRVEILLNDRLLSSQPWPNLPQAVAGSAPPHYRDVRFVPFLFI